MPAPASPPPFGNDLHGGRVAARLEVQGADILLLVPIHDQQAEGLLDGSSAGVRHEPLLLLLLLTSGFELRSGVPLLALRAPLGLASLAKSPSACRWQCLVRGVRVC